VQERLAARATEAELERMLPPEAVAGQANRPATTGTALGASKRPGSAGPPTSVPASGGTQAKPKPPGKP
jgi:hypothetical protein